MTVKYIGDGAYFHGVPARDLTDEEFAALPEAQQQALLASGLYTQGSAPTRGKKAPAAEPAPVEPATGG